MRVAVVFAPERADTTLTAMARELARALQAKGHFVDIAEAKSGEAHRLTGYDYVIVGTAPVGLRGNIPPRLGDFLAQSGALQGKRAMAFVRKSGLSSAKALKRLMTVMESEGMIVNYAVIIASIQDAAEAARGAPLERN
ncbi:MAG: hypothetical protein M0Z80_04535 [Treponema sp.]|nr:hypothetical protein [Treponema sp.]